MPRVLLAEDDGVIARAMMAHLRRAGMDVEWAEDGDRALKKIRFDRPDVAVIDLMLPGEDGWRITRTLREEGITIPVIMISARGSEHDKVHGLKIGADDYLAKPFGMQELVARVEAALRRSGIAPIQEAGARIEAPGLVIDPDRHQALLEGADAGLTPMEFRLLYVLAAAEGEGAHPRPDPAARVGDAVPAPRPDGRRVRPQAAREDRPQVADQHLHLHPPGRGLQIRADLKE